MESSWDRSATPPALLHALPLIAYAIGDFAILTMTAKNSLMGSVGGIMWHRRGWGCCFCKAVTDHAMRNSRSHR